MRRKINWLEIKSEYLASTDSLNSILQKNKIHKGKSTDVHTRGWIEERKKLHQRILEQIKDRTVNTKLEQWESQQELWKSVEEEAKKILERAKKSEREFKPKDLAQLTVAIQNALKSQKLIIGEPTERIEERSLHLQLIQINKRIEKGDDIEGIPFKIREDSDSIQNQGQEEKSS